MFRTLMMILLGIVLTIVAALGGLAVFLQSEYGQKWLYEKALMTLQETLQTRISVGQVGFSLLKGEIVLSKVEIDDRQQEPMLRVDTLEGALDFKNLWHREIGLRSVKLLGATAHLYKEHPDTAANYQFVIDELKKRKAQKEDETEKKEKKKWFRLVMDTVVAEVARTYLTWDVRSLPHLPKGKIDPAHVSLQNLNAQLQCSLDGDSTRAFTLKDVEIHELQSNMHLSFDKAVIRKTAGTHGEGRGIDNLKITLDSLRYKYNNHRPRKNKGRPHRGWFDPGHVDIVLNADVAVHKLNKDTVLATVNNLSMTERESGLYIKRMNTEVEKYGKNIALTNTNIASKHTTISMKRVKAELLEDKLRLFRLTENAHVSAHVLLTDIARPFAPRLSHFTTPLELTVDVAGDLKQLLFNDIRVTTPDRRLSLSASGDLCNTLEKKQLCLHFKGIKLNARGGIKEQIVKHFAKQVRLKMMRQLAAIGDIQYNGSLGIYFKRENISGLLHTKYGNIRFSFTLDGNTKYMTGNMSTEAVDLGSIMNVKGLTIGNAQASYSFNISSRRGRRGGRLPQGWLKAKVDGAKYKIISFRDIQADITSDGSEATGTVHANKKLVSVVCDIIYRQTDKEQSFRVKPHLTLNTKEKNNASKKTEVTEDTTQKKKSWIGKLFSKKKKNEQEKE